MTQQTSVKFRTAMLHLSQRFQLVLTIYMHQYDITTS